MRKHFISRRRNGQLTKNSFDHISSFILAILSQKGYHFIIFGIYAFSGSYDIMSLFPLLPNKELFTWKKKRVLQEPINARPQFPSIFRELNPPMRALLYRKVVEKAAECGIRIGLWGSPDGFGDDPEVVPHLKTRPCTTAPICLSVDRLPGLARLCEDHGIYTTGRVPKEPRPKFYAPILSVWQNLRYIRSTAVKVTLLVNGTDDRSLPADLYLCDRHD